MRRKLKFRALLVLILTCLAAGFYIAYRVFERPTKAADTWMVPDAANPSKKFITKDTLINQIQQKQELIPLEVELSEKITIDDTWGNVEVFKKLQNIYFVGKGIYTVDLALMKAEKAELDSTRKTVELTLPKPCVKAITIDEQKTVYETPQRGALRFGDIRMTPAEYQLLVNRAKSRMSEKMLSSELYGQAMQNAEMAVIRLINSVIDEELRETYSITIKFEQ